LAEHLRIRHCVFAIHFNTLPPFFGTSRFHPTSSFNATTSLRARSTKYTADPLPLSNIHQRRAVETVITPSGQNLAISCFFPMCYARALIVTSRFTL